MVTIEGESEPCVDELAAGSLTVPVRIRLDRGKVFERMFRKADRWSKGEFVEPVDLASERPIDDL